MTFQKASIYPQFKEEVVAVLNSMSQFTKTAHYIQSNISLYYFHPSLKIPDMPE